MTQQSSSATDSIWGKFALKQAAQNTQSSLIEAGISPEQITIETENFQSPVQLEDTKAIGNLKSGAITGAVLGGLIGLSISLILTGFAREGLAALRNFEAIHYFAPIMGAIVGAAGISSILGISGSSVLKAGVERDKYTESLRHLVVVKGTPEEISLTKQIVAQQGGEIEEADRR